MSELKHQNSEIYPRKTPDCKYDVARQEWDRRIGSKVVLIAQLKIAIIVVFIFAVSACCVACVVLCQQKCGLALHCPG